VVTIFVDGDACPVKEETYRVAARYAVAVVVVANIPLRGPASGEISFVQVSGGADRADDWIAETAEVGDIVAIARGAAAIDFRGGEFTTAAIGDLLASREIARWLRSTDSYGGGPAPFRRQDRGRYMSKLDEVINRLRRRQRDER
jgi:uncharacterized protein YaiI (UPF0178 family)